MFFIKKIRKQIVLIFLFLLFINISYANYNYNWSEWQDNLPGKSASWKSITSSSDGVKLAAVSNGAIGSIWTSNDSGATWLERTSAGKRNWYAITSSSDGTKLAAVVSNGGIWTSTDSGATWTQMTSAGTRTWLSIACSGDGNTLIAGVSSGYVYISTNSGITWTMISALGSGIWYAVTSSSDGTKLAAAAFNGNIWTSSDSGGTWITHTQLGTKYWRCITSSSDGTKLAVGVSSGYIYTGINNEGVWSWTERTGCGSRSWYSITSSSDGTKLAAVVTNFSIWTSIDSGSSWTERTGAGSRIWYSITSSSDGAKLAAVVSDGSIWISSNSGASWTAAVAGSSRKWRSITSSSDGTKLAAISNYDYVYTSSDSGATWMARTGPGTQSWCAIASSSDGAKLAIVGSYTNIYVSTDSGATWVSRGLAKDWMAITMSNDGTILAAVSYTNGSLWVSKDSGATWSERTVLGTKYWHSIACSGDGAKLAAVVYNGSIWTSSDSGDTWVERNSLGSKQWYGIAISNDGAKLAAAEYSYNGNIYTSDNFGETWIARTSAGSRYWYSITCSDDGTKLAALNSYNSIWTSIDSGLTWKEQTGSGIREWQSIASSGDGGKLAACANYGGIVLGEFINIPDTTPPTFTSSLSNYTWTNNPSPPMLNFAEATDEIEGSGVSINGYEIYWGTDSNGQTVHKFGSSDYAPAQLTEWGTYYLRARAQDNAGNFSAWRTICSYQFDNQNPATTTINPSTIAWSNNVNFILDTGSADAGGSGVNRRQYKIDNGSWINYSGTVTISTDGQHTIYARVIDNANNISDETFAVVYCDTTPPSVPMVLTEKYKLSDNSDPGIINFGGSSDGSSGLADVPYQVYWGPDPGGTSSEPLLADSYDPDLLTFYGKYYLRVRALDKANNASAWKTVYTYEYSNAAVTYTFINTIGSSTNITATDNVRYARKDGNLEIGHVSINMQELGLDFYENNFSDILIDKDNNGNPFITVSSNGDLGQAVNGNDKWIPIKLGPFIKKPIIKYAPDDESYSAITKYSGGLKAGVTNIQNYNFDGSYVTFEVNHFSTYGSAIVDSVLFEDSQLLASNYGETIVLTINVKDTMGDDVEDAPVTFNIQSGGGLLNGGFNVVMVKTNAAGIATINYTFPNVNQTSIAKADVDGTFGTITLLMNGELTDQEAVAYESWRLKQSPSDIGGFNDDPDHDGVKNLLEWNWGIDSTSANLVDTDSDGINDKFDAFPNNFNKKIFNTNYNPDFVPIDDFSGVSKGLNIVAVSGNLTLKTLVDMAYSRSATVDSIADDTRYVMEINGLAKPTVRDGNLAFASSTYDNSKGLYRSLKPGQEYSVYFAYINRGNDIDSYGSTINLEQQASRWTANTNSNSGLTNVAPWQRAYLEVSVLPNSANAFERVTLDVTIGYDAGHAVNYNAFAEANIYNTFDNEGLYGGEQSFNYTFQLEAQGYELTVLSRTITINAPIQNGYSGNQSDFVPGAKIRYSIVLFNNSYSTATSINIKDTVPNNCHLYFTERPAVLGAENWYWKGETNNNAGPASQNAVNFEITIPARSLVTASYTVTVD